MRESDKETGRFVASKTERLCEVDGCSNPHRAKGLCTPHYNSTWHQKNKSTVSKRQTAYYKQNREKLIEYTLQWSKENAGLKNAANAAYRSAKKQATPAWTKNEDITESFKAIYIESQLKGKHVDHIVPLTNPHVCGLHVPWNLQLVNQAENNQKYNHLTLESLSLAVL